MSWASCFSESGRMDWAWAVMVNRKIAARAMNARDILKFMRGIVSWRRLRAQSGEGEERREDSTHRRGGHGGTRRQRSLCLARRARTGVSVPARGHRYCALSVIWETEDAGGGSLLKRLG